MNRRITFGKYKGEYIIKLIMTHIGYIMWCLKNVRGFRLTNEEQIVYDAMAISIKRDGCEMTFPIDEMINFVSDKDALKELYSPIQTTGKHFYVVPNPDKIKERIIDLAYKLCGWKELTGDELNLLNAFANKELKPEKEYPSDVIFDFDFQLHGN